MASSEWLSLSDDQVQLDFYLYDCVVPYSACVELFHHFSRHYYPHFACLESVSSLRKLASEGELLFWTIILTAAQWHVMYHEKYAEIQAVHAQLLGKVCREAIQSLYDVQAVLMLCTWYEHLYFLPLAKRLCANDGCDLCQALPYLRPA